MGRTTVGLADRIEPWGQSMRIRITWNGARPNETNPDKATSKGIAATGDHYARVKELLRLGVTTDDCCAKLFTRSAYELDRKSPNFGEFAQA